MTLLRFGRLGLRDNKMLVLAQPHISNHDAIKFNGRQINKNSHSHNYSQKKRKRDSKFEAITAPQGESQVYEPQIHPH